MENARWLLNILVLLLPLPFIANTFGWIITEAGRQPWMVVGLQKVSDAVSQNITSTEVLITLVGFTLIYALLAVAAIFIALKFVKKMLIRWMMKEAGIMDLQIVWFILVTVLFVGFFFLEGFDYGVGTILPFLRKMM